jgi:hypothetical protein
LVQEEISSDLLGCAKVPTAGALIELVARYEDARRRDLIPRTAT